MASLFVIVNSPLGKYAQAVAAVTAVGIITAWIVAVFLNGVGVTVEVAGLKEVALIAIGAVFGSAAAVNGVKAPIDSAHTRIDRLETGTGIQTHGSYVNVPEVIASAQVAEVTVRAED